MFPSSFVRVKLFPKEWLEKDSRTKTCSFDENFTFVCIILGFVSSAVNTRQHAVELLSNSDTTDTSLPIFLVLWCMEQKNLKPVIKEYQFCTNKNIFYLCYITCMTSKSFQGENNFRKYHLALGYERTRKWKLLQSSRRSHPVESF